MNVQPTNITTSTAWPVKEQRTWTSFRLFVSICLVIIIVLLANIAYLVRSQGKPVIVRQCITIDAPAGTTKVGCGP